MKQPKIGAGTFFSNTSILIPRKFPVIEKEAKMTKTVKKRMVMARNSMSVPTMSSTIALNDKGIDGDEIPGDGRYSSYFKATNRDGIYTFRLIASSDQTRMQDRFSREKVISIPIRTTVHPQSSTIRIKARDFKSVKNETMVKFVVTPCDRFGNKVGPGITPQLGFDVKGKIVDIKDLSDGSFQVEMLIPGDYRKDISVLPVRHIKKNKGNMQKSK